VGDNSRSAVVIRRMNTKLMINGKWCCIQRSEEAWAEFQVQLQLYSYTIAIPLTIGSGKEVIGYSRG